MAAPYGEASSALAAWRADPETVYFWDRDEKCRLLTSQLGVVHTTWLKPTPRELSSSDSEDEIRYGTVIYKASLRFFLEIIQFKKF